MNYAELKEIEEIIQLSKKIEKKKAKIFFDGKQFSVRIPKHFAESVGIKAETDEIEFEMTIPNEPEKMPTLRMELVRADV
ncbi:MAG: hypothetical protein PHN89_05770 [Candidatus Pacebacteria bacterium]|nr:hypothetical protein [Candidatus Paceibacterota bacterium]